MEYTNSKSNFGSLSFGLRSRPAKRSCPEPAEFRLALPFSRTSRKKRAWNTKDDGVSGLPVCPAGEISDRVLYLAGPDVSGKLYLPRYRVAELQLPDHSQYRVSLKKSRLGWALEVRLEKYPCPGFSAPECQLEELPHEVSVTLRSSGIPEGGAKEISFQELFRTATGLNVVLNIPNLSERDRIYHMLTEPGCRTELIVSRRIEVAVPFELRDTANLPSDSSCFRKVRSVLENPIPFSFPPELHEYIFRDLKGVSGIGFTCRQVEAHNYYQARDNPHVFYYLPDSFRLARRLSPPYTPLLSVRFTGQGKVNLEYTARPSINQKRLEKAAKLLEAFVSDYPDYLPEEQNEEQKVQLRPLLPEPGKLKYYLGLPGKRGEGPLRERKGANLCLQRGIRDRLVLTVPELREVFEALYRPESAIFQGRVEIELEGGMKDAVPFIARLDCLEGRIFDWEEKPDASGCREVTLKNQIESPLRIRGLTAKFVREPGEVIAAKIPDSPQFQFPLNLKPAEELHLSFLPERTLPEGAFPFQLKLEVEDPEVLPDPEAVWNSIAEPGISSEPWFLTVKTFVFRDEEAAANIEELIVEFAGGKTVELTRKCSTSKVILELPLKDRVLQHADFDLCRYTVKIVDRKGRVSKVLEGTVYGDLLIVEGV